MIVRNRIIALLYRIAAFALLLTSFQFTLMEYSSFWTAMSGFDMLMGLMMVVMFGFVIVFNLIDLRHGMHGMAAGPYMPIALPLMAFSMVAGIVYFAYVLPLGCAPNSFFSLVFHALLIIAPLIEWLLFDEKGTVRFSTGFAFMTLAIFYYVFGYFRTVIWPETPVYGTFVYAYPCLDFRNPHIVLASVIYFASLLGAVTLVIFLNNVFCGKYRRL